MVGIDLSISLSDLSSLPTKLQKKLDKRGINNLSQIFLYEKKLQDAVTLAKNTDLTIHEALETRYFGRHHLESTLADITAKRKVEPVELLWKSHWLLGIVPDGDFRKELIALEASAIATILETLEDTNASTIETVLQILLHRLLIIPETTMKAELEQIIEFAEKFQRNSLLAYQTAKAKDTINEFTQEDDPTKQIALLRKLTRNWKALHKIMEDRGRETGKIIVTALQSIDDLKVLDISEQHLKDRLHQTMSTQKLRQSQLKHLTTAMNAAIELRDAYSTAKLATRASTLWFEMAQGKSDKAFGDDLLRSLRFARTAVFNYRALDDIARAVKQLDYILRLTGEISSDSPEILEEATTGTLKTLISTIPLLDRPIDQNLILRMSKQLDRLLARLMPKIEASEARYVLAKLHVKFQQIALNQLQQLNTEPEASLAIHRELIKAILRLTEAAPDAEKDSLLSTAAKYATQLIPEISPSTKINDQDLEVVSKITQQLSQRPVATISESAHLLMERSNQLNEHLYFQTKDPKIRAQLALQLLISTVTPDSSGKISASFPTKDLDKLEDYATTAMVAQVKGRHQAKALKAGSLLIWILLQRITKVTDVQDAYKLKKDAQEFVEQTLTFMPAVDKITKTTYPFAFLLLRNINALVHDEHPAEDSQWETLLTKSENLAQTLAKAAAAQGDTHNEILALSAAGSATAKLATLSTSAGAQHRLLRRATTQIEKALKAAAKEENPITIEAALSQYNQLMQTRLRTNPTLSTQILIFKEWDLVYQEGIEALESIDVTEAATRLQASRILNTQVPLTFTSLAQGKDKLDSVRRQLTELLREASQIGSKEQAQLATQLERQWAFQLGDESILDSGFRLEDAETSFTLADEQFRISLQIEPEISIDGQIQMKTRTFSNLRPSTKPTDLIWYEITPILCSTYKGDKIQSWLTLQKPSENNVSIGFWLITTEDLAATVTLQILGVDALSQDPEAVMIQIPGAQVELPRLPVVAEHREAKGILIYELNLTNRLPDTITMNIEIA